MIVRMDIIQTLQTAALRAHPAEACGILYGNPERITDAEPAANVHPAPETHFEIDPAALIAAHRRQREGGPRIVGYYHSHPAGQAIPSPTDRALAAHDGMVWAIIAGESVRLWRDGDAGFDPLPYDIDPR